MTVTTSDDLCKADTTNTSTKKGHENTCVDIIIIHNTEHKKAIGLPFALIVNVHFLHCYLPSRAYAREPPFNHSDLIFSRIPTQPSKLTFHRKVKVTAVELTNKSVTVQA